MMIKDALPERKVNVVVYAYDNADAIPILRGSSRDNDKIFQAEYMTVAPSEKTYKFYCKPIID